MFCAEKHTGRHTVGKIAESGMSDSEQDAAAAALAERWIDLDGDSWDVFFSNGQLVSSFGIIAMGRRVGSVPRQQIGFELYPTAEVHDIRTATGASAYQMSSARSSRGTRLP